MNELPSTHTETALSLVAADVASRCLDESDYALGCECADPSLQIERWNESAPATAADFR